MPEKYGRPLLIIVSLLAICYIFISHSDTNCYTASKYNNTLQHDINSIQVCK
jgi:hypothetical protein